MRRFTRFPTRPSAGSTFCIENDALREPVATFLMLPSLPEHFAAAFQRDGEEKAACCDPHLL